MAEKSVGKQFLELAIEFERKGYTFYEAVAQKSKNKDVQSAFRKLSSREKEHEHTFRDMLTRLGGYSTPTPVEDFQYVRSVAESNIFTGERARKLLAREVMSDIEAIEAGIGFEKDSILFYSEVQGTVPRHDQDIMDMIINEEKKHLSELMYLADNVRMGIKI